MARIDRSVANESNSKLNEYNNSNTDLETKNVKYKRGRECSERTITNISLINKIERNKIGRAKYTSSESEWTQSIISSVTTINKFSNNKNSTINKKM